MHFDIFPWIFVVQAEEVTFPIRMQTGVNLLY